MARSSLEEYWAGSISANINHPIKKKNTTRSKTKIPRKKKLTVSERKTQRVLSHARVLASTMKAGERKTIPRQQINGGKVMIEKGRGNDYRVYAASDNKYNVNSRKNAYGINIYKGSTDKTSVTFQARHFKMGNVDKYQFNKWHERLFTFKSGKKRYKAGKTGSMGG